jgi:hypothetical protein
MRSYKSCTNFKTQVRAPQCSYYNHIEAKGLLKSRSYSTQISKDTYNEFSVLFKNSLGKEVINLGPEKKISDETLSKNNSVKRSFSSGLLAKRSIASETLFKQEERNSTKFRHSCESCQKKSSLISKQECKYKNENSEIHPFLIKFNQHVKDFDKENQSLVDDKDETGSLLREDLNQNFEVVKSLNFFFENHISPSLGPFKPTYFTHIVLEDIEKEALNDSINSSFQENSLLPPPSTKSRLVEDSFVSENYNLPMELI